MCLPLRFDDIKLINNILIDTYSGISSPCQVWKGGDFSTRVSPRLLRPLLLALHRRKLPRDALHFEYCDRISKWSDCFDRFEPSSDRVAPLLPTEAKPEAPKETEPTKEAEAPREIS